MVLEQIITTLATVADTAEEKFLSYYDRFMPTLKYVMENAVPRDLRLLRGKTIECISLIGLAVGHDKVQYGHWSKSILRLFSEVSSIITLMTHT